MECFNATSWLSTRLCNHNIMGLKQNTNSKKNCCSKPANGLSHYSQKTAKFFGRSQKKSSKTKIAGRRPTVKCLQNRIAEQSYQIAPAIKQACRYIQYNFGFSREHVYKKSQRTRQSIASHIAEIHKTSQDI